MSNLLWRDYLWNTLCSLETEPDSSILDVLITELRCKVLDSMCPDETVHLNLLHTRFREFDKGVQNNKGRYTNKQIRRLIETIKSELYLLKDPRAKGTKTAVSSAEKYRLSQTRTENNNTNISVLPTSQSGMSNVMSDVRSINEFLAPSKNPTDPTTNLNLAVREEWTPSVIEKHFLNDILQSTLDQLSDNAMDSTWTVVITEMVDQMFTFLTDDELATSRPTIEKILATLKNHGWTGVDFYSAPDKKSLRKMLSSFIYIEQ